MKLPTCFRALCAFSLTLQICVSFTAPVAFAAPGGIPGAPEGSGPPGQDNGHGNAGGSNGNGPPIGLPPVVTPPIEVPPVITPPVLPPVVTPPVVTPPVITPPVITPPVVTPPVITPPVITPPVITPPVITPPVTTPPVVTPPVVTPPVITPPVGGPPVVTPPVTVPPVVTPPVELPPVVTPPNVIPPVEMPPVLPPSSQLPTIFSPLTQSAPLAVLTNTSFTNPGTLARLNAISPLNFSVPGFMTFVVPTDTKPKTATSPEPEEDAIEQPNEKMAGGYRQISFPLSPAKAMRVDEGMPIGTRSRIVRTAGPLEMSLKGKHSIHLTSGTVLIHAMEPLEVETPDGSIHIKRGAVALVGRTPDALRVLNLYDDSSSSVRLVHGAQTIVLGPGQEVLVGEEEIIKMAASLRDTIPRRKTQIVSSSMAPDVVLRVADFSLSSMLGRDAVLSSLRHSANPRDAALTYKLVKMAAVLHIATGHRGRYTIARQPM